MKRQFASLGELYGFVNGDSFMGKVAVAQASDILDRLEVAMEYEKLLAGWSVAGVEFDFDLTWSVTVAYRNGGEERTVKISE